MVKHTKCGMATFKGADAVEVVRRNCGEGAAEGVSGVVWGEFGKGLEEEVRLDVEFLRGCGELNARGGVSGWVYEVESGRVRRVV